MWTTVHSCLGWAGFCFCKPIQENGQPPKEGLSWRGLEPAPCLDECKLTLTTLKCIKAGGGGRDFKREKRHWSDWGCSLPHSGSVLNLKQQGPKLSLLKVGKWRYKTLSCIVFSLNSTMNSYLWFLRLFFQPCWSFQASRLLTWILLSTPDPEPPSVYSLPPFIQSNWDCP